MLVDQNEFFKKASLHICSSLDFGQALERAYHYISRVLPIDGIFANVVQNRGKTIRTVAKITSNSGLQRDIFIPLPPDCQNHVNNSLKKWNASRQVEAAKIVPKSELTVMGRLEGPILGYDKRCIMVQYLNIEGEYFGTLIASSKMNQQFTDDHLALYESLHRPFSIAFANALTHERLIVAKNRLADENNFLTQELKAHNEFNLVGTDGGMKHVTDMIRQVAPLNNTVLLLGETGTGKEVIANAIHYNSSRQDGPFVKVNCGAIPENLIDSELFGHEKGAFTGANSRKIGRFERANGGTIFLDEIGELPMAAQVRLLRVLQTKEIERVGGSETIPVDIRVIAATHRKLEQMITENRFREDLWYRINVFPIIIPPLRQRREDIPLLIHHFIDKKAREMGLRSAPEIAQGALEQLLDYHWPGNVRELENVVERAMIQNRGRSFLLDPYSFATIQENSQAVDKVHSHCVFPCLAKQQDNMQPEQPATQIRTLDETVTAQIKSALKVTNGKVGGQDGAAKLLGINPSTLRNRMDKLGIEYGKQSIWNEKSA